jgi:hypothetical protein
MLRPSWFGQFKTAGAAGGRKGSFMNEERDFFEEGSILEAVIAGTLKTRET